VIRLLVAATLAAASATAAPAAVRSAYSVPAERESLSSARSSPVVHDNEVMALAAHSGRLFAATDQWQYPGSPAYGQVLVKDSPGAGWRIFERTQSRRVEVLDTFPIPADQGLGRGHSLLVTQAIVGGRSRIQWLLDGARSFGHSHALPSTGVDVRSFGAHESSGTWAVYAGANPTGILRGVWSRRRHTLVFDGRPELTAAPPTSPGLKTQKVTGFADCGGALYVTINRRLYRRNDGALPAGVARWALVYEEPPVGPRNSGLRGLSCVSHRGSPSLVVSTEGDGNVYRFDHLRRSPVRLVPTLELQPRVAIARMLGGTQAIGYVIAAYNNFETMKLGGFSRQLFGLEWRYTGGCPSTRVCAPDGFDAAACFAVRTDRGASPAYSLHCLSGRRFTPSRVQASPVRQGQAFVAIRTIKLSPFGDGRIYYGGYDCNFSPADGAAWVGSSAAGAIRTG
jgi:hypothetical protein